MFEESECLCPTAFVSNLVLYVIDVHFCNVHVEMCGIWAYAQLQSTRPVNKQDTSHVVRDFWNISHRGPDTSTLLTFDKNRAIAGFHRLSIVDTSHRSNQPFVSRTHTRTIVFMCNGEIYNYKYLLEKYDLDTSGGSNGIGDCMALFLLYQKFTNTSQFATHDKLSATQEKGNHDLNGFVNALREDVRGEYAFVVMEFDACSESLIRVVAGRDPVGVRPLYYNESALDQNASYLCISSEIKGFVSQKDSSVIEFDPGCVKIFNLAAVDVVPVTMQQIRFYDVASQSCGGSLVWQLDGEYNTQRTLSKIRSVVVRAVQERLHAHRPLAFLLSGGVDSSLVCAIATRILKCPIRTFCCGMAGGTDLAYARKAANHIGSIHTEVLFTPEEALKAISEVVRATETWDTTTIRASTGQYLVSKHISTQTDCRVLLVGEGPDEVCSSYLFNWYCPDGNSLQESAVDLVRDMHMYDIRRGDRCISHWGMEARVPFLDPEFIQTYWSIPPELRHPAHKGIEKWWLRAAFADFDLLPDEVLWRKKEAFSDGVSATEQSWFSIIQQHSDTVVSDDEMEREKSASKYPHCTPPTKEAMWFRNEFCKHYPHNQNCISGYWQPKYDSFGKKVGGYVDPSARNLEVYECK